MKINPPEHIQSINPPAKVVQDKTARQDSFSQVFNDTLNAKEVVSDNAILPSVPVSSQPPAQPNVHFYESLEQSFDHLEGYQTMLGDASVSLREMEPAVNLLKEDAEHLSQLLDGVQPDERMKPLMQETLSLLTREIGRFEQGDYVD